jgi:hypothetical protein
MKSFMDGHHLEDDISTLPDAEKSETYETET